MKDIVSYKFDLTILFDRKWKNLKWSGCAIAYTTTVLTATNKILLIYFYRGMSSAEIKKKKHGGQTNGHSRRNSK